MAVTGAGVKEAMGPRPADDGRLARGVLNDVDIAALTLADMAPAMSFYFSFATIVAAAGIAAVDGDRWDDRDRAAGQHDQPVLALAALDRLVRDVHRKGVRRL